MNVRIIYHTKPDQIDVLAVLHPAMNVLGSQDKNGGSTWTWRFGASSARDAGE